MRGRMVAQWLENPRSLRCDFAHQRTTNYGCNGTFALCGERGRTEKLGKAREDHELHVCYAGAPQPVAQGQVCVVAGADHRDRTQRVIALDRPNEAQQFIRIR